MWRRACSRRAPPCGCWRRAGSPWRWRAKRCGRCRPWDCRTTPRAAPLATTWSSLRMAPGLRRGAALRRTRRRRGARLRPGGGGRGAVAEVCRRLDGLPLAIELLRRGCGGWAWPGWPPAWTPDLTFSLPGAGGDRPGSRPCGPPWTGATTCWSRPSRPSWPASRSSPGASTSRRREAVAAGAGGRRGRQKRCPPCWHGWSTARWWCPVRRAGGGATGCWRRCGSTPPSAWRTRATRRPRRCAGATPSTTRPWPSERRPGYGARPGGLAGPPGCGAGEHAGGPGLGRDRRRRRSGRNRATSGGGAVALLGPAGPRRRGAGASGAPPRRGRRSAGRPRPGPLRGLLPGLAPGGPRRRPRPGAGGAGPGRSRRRRAYHAVGTAGPGRHGARRRRRRGR